MFAAISVMMNRKRRLNEFMDWYTLDLSYYSDEFDAQSHWHTWALRYFVHYIIYTTRYYKILQVHAYKSYKLYKMFILVQHFPIWFTLVHFVDSLNDTPNQVGFWDPETCGSNHLVQVPPGRTHGPLGRIIRCVALPFAARNYLNIFDNKWR